MERALSIRSLSSTSAFACTRLFSRSLHRLARISSTLQKRHRFTPNLYRQRSLLLRSHLRYICTASPPSLHFKRQFYPLAIRAFGTSSAPASPEFLVLDDDVADKYGFEKVSEQFIEECK